MLSPGLQEGTGGGGTAPAAAGGAAAARGPLLGGVCPRQAPSPGRGEASSHPRPTHGGTRGAVDTGSPGEKPRMWRRSRGPLSLCGRPPFFPHRQNSMLNLRTVSWESLTCPSSMTPGPGAAPPHPDPARHPVVPAACSVALTACAVTSTHVVTEGLSVPLGHEPKDGGSALGRPAVPPRGRGWAQSTAAPRLPACWPLISHFIECGESPAHTCSGG